MTETATSSIEPLDEPALLAQHRRLGRLRFPAHQEDDFNTYMHNKMRGRVGAVAVTAIGYMLLFFWVDYRYLPPEIKQISIPVRAVVLLLVISSLWFVNRPGRVKATVAFNVATLAYVLVGLAVAGIILLCRTYPLQVPVTHDGLYLVLLAGTFLVGLPSRHSVFGSWSILLCYLAGEIALG